MDYQQSHSLFVRAGVEPDPPEAHGVLVGLFAGRDQVSVMEWLETIGMEKPEQDNLAPEHQRALYDFFIESRDALNDGQLRFYLMLPPDEEQLAERVAALTEWCEGFLYGLSNAGVTDFKQVPDDVRELLMDFAEITRATTVSESNEEENSFAEVVEYVRMGALVVKQSLHNARRSS